jgi:uncharacterized membrane protein YfcA
VVPALLFSTGLDILKAVGTSLISVETFGVVTAAAYLLKGLVESLTSLLYLAGGHVGARAASAVPRRTLRRIFAGVLIAVAVYIMARNLPYVALSF